MTTDQELIEVPAEDDWPMQSQGAVFADLAAQMVLCRNTVNHF
jgi:hypothetical protein